MNKSLLLIILLALSFVLFAQKERNRPDIKNIRCLDNINAKNRERLQQSVESLALDRKEFYGNIKWLSFPRLNRYSYGNDAVDVKSILLEQMYPEGSVFSLLNDENKKLKRENNQWIISQFETVKSTEGYKLNVEEWASGKSPQWNFIDYQGGKIDPNTSISITGGEENWIGYFIEYPQKVEDALPPDVLNDVVYIKAQDWAMFNEGTPGNPNFTYQGKVRPLEWGDMIEIYTNSAHVFQWNQGTKKDAVPALKTEYYSYEEKLDYEPIFVLTDENSEVQEIAVKVDGEVKGAAVREAGDTLVQVNAYLEGVDPDAQITLETYSGGKSPVRFIPDYLVRNHRTTRMEKRKLFAGEKARYQVVSIRPQDQGVLPDPMDQLSVYPNPAAQNLHFDFLLNQTSRLQMQIFNNLGQLVASPLQSSLNKGYYSLSWDLRNAQGRKVPAGVYFYHIVFPDLGIQKNGKIIIR